MSASRTVTVHTTDHGAIIVPEPDWCTGHAGDWPGYRGDFTHDGREQPLRYDGGQLRVMLTQSPFAAVGSREVRVFVEQSGYAMTLDPAGLDALAAALVAHAAYLRTMARELAVLLARGVA